MNSDQSLPPQPPTPSPKRRRKPNPFEGLNKVNHGNTKSRFMPVDKFLLGNKEITMGCLAHYLRISKTTIIHHEHEGKIPEARKDDKGVRWYNRDEFLELYRHFYIKSFQDLERPATEEPS